MKIWKKVMVFALGGSAYFCLELLWRGRSHGSMFALGGLCFCLIGRLEKLLASLAPAARMGVGALTVTALELGAGLLVNRDYTVWDYRRLPYNFMGQICLCYSLLWLPVVLAAMLLHRGAEKAMANL